MNQKIIPALLPSSLAELRRDITSLAAVHELQIDLVDGDFVPFASWPYDPPGDITEITDDILAHSVEVDLMVHEQLAMASACASIGVQMVIFHVPGVRVQEVAGFADAHPDISVAVAFTSDASLEQFEQYAEFVDMVQLMGIAKIGAQGMPFDDRVIDRIKTIRSRYPRLMISVDGSMNETTIPQVRDAGADRFVVGSALLQASDRMAQFSALSELAG